jgi:outer membrane protein assembly factor BamB
MTVSTTFYDPAETSQLVALDAKTGRVIWDREMPHAGGDRKFSLLLNGDKLHVLDEGPSCYNKTTGEPLYENGLDMYNPNAPCLSSTAYNRGHTLANNKIYYVNGLTAPFLPTGVIRGESILCINADTGAFVWGAVNPHRGSESSVTLGTMPVVHKGRAYIVTDRGLRVYNADTGKLLGVDNSAKNYGGYNDNFIYKDYYVYVHDNDASASLIATQLE